MQFIVIHQLDCLICDFACLSRYDDTKTTIYQYNAYRYKTCYDYCDINCILLPSLSLNPPLPACLTSKEHRTLDNNTHTHTRHSLSPLNIYTRKVNGYLFVSDKG